MSKQVYISADYSETDGDREVVEELQKWGKDNLHKVDFSLNASIKKLSLTHGEVYAGDVVKDFKDSRSFTFMFELPK